MCVLRQFIRSRINIRVKPRKHSIVSTFFLEEFQKILLGSWNHVVIVTIISLCLRIRQNPSNKRNYFVRGYVFLGTAQQTFFRRC